MRSYQLINKVCGHLESKRSFFRLTPYGRNIGNCAEEMYYGLLKARRTGKQVAFLFGQRLFWKFRLDEANRELYDVESPYRLPRCGALRHIAECILTLLFVFLRNYHLRCERLMHRLRRDGQRAGRDFELNIRYVVPTIGRSGLWQAKEIDHFSWDHVKACSWKEQYDKYLPVRLRDEKYRRAERLRVEMGIPLSSWYVCLHVREAGFRFDSDFARPRNSSIVYYVEAIRAITHAGGFVVRMGDASMTRLPAMERVIDYPHTRFKSELMDIYLISQCRFFVGVNSGLLDVAWLFQKRVVLTNLTEWTLSYPKCRWDLAIIKHIFSRSGGKFLSLIEVLDEPFACQFLNVRESDYIKNYFLVENTPEEIRDVVVEFMDSSEDQPYSELQQAFNSGRRAQIHRWLSSKELVLASDPMDDAVERYRIASRADSYAGALGRKYLEQNWMRDSFGERFRANRGCDGDLSEFLRQIIRERSSHRAAPGRAQ